MPIYKRKDRPEVGDLKMYLGDQAGLSRYLLRGWAIADGNNGTANLIDRFPKFGAVEDKGSQGGAKTVTPTGTVSVDGHTLSESQIAAHDHDHQLAGRDGNSNGSNIETSNGSESAGDINGRLTIYSAGSSLPHAHGAGFAGSAQNNEPQHTICVPLQYVGFAA